MMAVFHTPFCGEEPSWVSGFGSISRALAQHLEEPAGPQGDPSAAVQLLAGQITCKLAKCGRVHGCCIYMDNLWIIYG